MLTKICQENANKTGVYAASKSFVNDFRHKVLLTQRNTLNI